MSANAPKKRNKNHKKSNDNINETHQSEADGNQPNKYTPVGLYAIIAMLIFALIVSLIIIPLRTLPIPSQKINEENAIKTNIGHSINGTGEISDSTANSNVNIQTPFKLGKLYFAGACIGKNGANGKKCGEDAFVATTSESNDKILLAVADGVGGWSTSGGDSSIVSNAILKAIAEKLDSVEPSLIIPTAFSTLHSMNIKKSSTTVCAAIYTSADGTLDVCNVGDSGAIVTNIIANYSTKNSPDHARDSKNSTIMHKLKYETIAGQDGFNAPHQLGYDQSGSAYGNVDIQQTCGSTQLTIGDVILVMSDGVIDNVWNQELVSIIDSLMGEFKEIALNKQQGSINEQLIIERLQTISNILTHVAKEKSKERLWISPFGNNALKHGFFFQGGKEDDISIIVGIVL